MPGIPAAIFQSIEFRAGCTAWNDGDAFAAHEHWEALWLDYRGPDRSFIQGLIQLAAALVKIERGQLRGAHSLLAKADRNLGESPPVPGWVAAWLSEYTVWKGAVSERVSPVQWSAERPLWQVPKQI